MKDKIGVPYFARLRSAGERKGEAILWPFHFDSRVDVVKSGLVEAIDRDFFSKRAKAIWRGGLGTHQHNLLQSLEFVNRYNLARKSFEKTGSMIDAKFVLSSQFQTIFERVSNDANSLSIASESSQIKELLSDMLSYRYLVATEDEDGINDDMIVSSKEKFARPIFCYKLTNADPCLSFFCNENSVDAFESEHR